MQTFEYSDNVNRQLSAVYSCLSEGYLYCLTSRLLTQPLQISSNLMQCDRLTVSHESFNRPFQTVGNSVTSACGKISEYPSLRHVLSLLIIQAVNVIHSYHLFIYFSTCSIIFSNTTCYCNLTYLLLVFIYILSLVIHSYAPNYVRHIHSYTNSKKTKLIN